MEDKTPRNKKENLLETNSPTDNMVSPWTKRIWGKKVGLKSTSNIKLNQEKSSLSQTDKDLLNDVEADNVFQ